MKTVLLFEAATDCLTPPNGTRPLPSNSAQQTINTDVSECMSAVKSNITIRLFLYCYHYISLPKAPQSLTLPMAIVGSVLFLFIIVIVTLILAAIFTKRSGSQCKWDTSCAHLFYNMPDCISLVTKLHAHSTNHAILSLKVNRKKDERYCLTS